MSLTVQQLLNDAKRLSSRLRDHDQSADHLISRAQEVLKEVDAMRQYQEDVENLNEVAHNRPRAQLVLGIQQENRHIRTLQQENKELRAALEEHQNALELIMSKYRQHVTRLVNAPHPDFTNINHLKIQALAERTEKVSEMAAVMKEAVRVDEAACNQQQETVVRLITENKGLRELLEISQRSLSTPVQRPKRPTPTIHKEVQTEAVADEIEVVTLPRPGAARIAIVKSLPVPEPNLQEDDTGRTSADLSSGDSDETGSEDESIKFDTIQRAGRRRTMVEKVEEKVEEKMEEKRDKEKVVEKQEKKEEEKQQDGVVEKLLDELVSKSMEENSSVKEDEKGSVKEKADVVKRVEEKTSVKEDEKEKAGVVERVVEQLVSDTVDGSSPAQSSDTSHHPKEKEMKTSLVSKVEDKLTNSDSTKLSNEKSDTAAANHIDGQDNATKDGGDTVKEEVKKSGETSKGSVEPTRSNKKSEDLVEKENAPTNLVEADSETKSNDPTEDTPGEKNDSASVASKVPSSNHSRSNSRGKKGKGDRNSPKKKKPNS